MTSLVEPVAWSRARGAALRTAAPLALAIIASAVLIWGRSYPGFPVSAAVIFILAALAALMLVLSARPYGRRSAVMLLVVTLVLAAGIATTAFVGDKLLQGRWSASVAAFSGQVQTFESAPAVESPDGNATWGHVPSECPPGLGMFSLSECVTVGRGYLFLQAPNAVTDSSGIAYLPEGDNPETTGLSPADLTPLGGPWWSWTCHC